MGLWKRRGRRSSLGLVFATLLACVTAISVAEALPASGDRYEGKTANGQRVAIFVGPTSKRLSAMWNVAGAELKCDSERHGPSFSGLHEVGNVRIKRDRRFARTSRDTSQHKFEYVHQEPYPSSGTTRHPIVMEETLTASFRGRFSKDGRRVKGTLRATRHVKVLGTLPEGATGPVHGTCDTGPVSFTAKLKRGR